MTLPLTSILQIDHKALAIVTDGTYIYAAMENGEIRKYTISTKGYTVLCTLPNKPLSIALDSATYGFVGTDQGDLCRFHLTTGVFTVIGKTDSQIMSLSRNSTTLYMSLDTGFIESHATS